MDSHERSGNVSYGLRIDRLNENQGAESTLSVLQSMLEVKQFAREFQGELRVNGKKASHVPVTERAGTPR